MSACGKFFSENSFLNVVLFPFLVTNNDLVPCHKVITGIIIGVTEPDSEYQTASLLFHYEILWQSSFLAVVAGNQFKTQAQIAKGTFDV